MTKPWRTVIIISIVALCLFLFLHFSRHIGDAIINQLHKLESFFEKHQAMGIVFAFAVAFLEALPIAGTIIPGTITMTLVGILVGSSILPLYTTMLACTLGAFAGDTIGFAIGRRYQAEALNIWPLYKYKKLILIAQHFFEKHGGKSIFIGRFVGPVRSCVPLIAGILNVSWLVFLSVALLSAAAWSFVYAAPGMIIGKAAIEHPTALIKLITMGTIWLICAWIIIWLLIQTYHIGSILADRLSRLFWARIKNNKHASSCVRMLSGQTPQQQHFPLRSLLAAAGFFLFFLLTLWQVYHQWPLTRYNHAIFYCLQSMHHQGLTAFAITITNLGFYKLVMLYTALVSGVLILHRNWKTALCLLLSVGLAIVLVGIFKHLFHSPRPSGFTLVKSSSSFPSGHTTMAIVFFGCLAFYTVQLKPCWKKIIYTSTTILIILIGLSRLYLGQHWLTDIIGSVFLGCSVLSINTLLFYRLNAKPNIPVTRWLLTIASAILIPWGAYSVIQFSQQKINITPLNQSITMTAETWWNQPHQLITAGKIPLYRHDRFGVLRQPLNLQWQGNLSQINHELKTLGFKSHHVQASLKRDIKSMTTHAADQLPLFPWLYRNKLPVLLNTYTLKKGQAVIEIRLWKSFIHLQNSSEPLWIGAINFHTQQHFFPIQSRLHTTTYWYQQQDPSQWLQHRLSHWQTKIITIKSKQPSTVLPMRWQAHVLLIKPH
jgi:membrane protein DedA with SNARE-associated domain/membrane-associated phospholipid phosphatase